MASRHEQVLAAVHALVSAAVPTATVKRNRAKPERPSPGGDVIIRDGDPGEPEVTLSPLTYTYTRRIPLEVLAFESVSMSREQALDQLLTAIGAAVAADRTLGGLCDWLDAEAADTDTAELYGAEPGAEAEAAILAIYSTGNPLS